MGQNVHQQSGALRVTAYGRLQTSHTARMETGAPGINLGLAPGPVVEEYGPAADSVTAHPLHMVDMSAMDPLLNTRYVILKNVVAHMKISEPSSAHNKAPITTRTKNIPGFHTNTQMRPRSVS